MVIFPFAVIFDSFNNIYYFSSRSLSGIRSRVENRSKIENAKQQKNILRHLKISNYQKNDLKFMWE